MPSAPRRTPDRLAIVTGTTSGVGLAVARELLDRGWRVLGAARRGPAIQHQTYEHVQVDLHDLDAVAAILEQRLTTIVDDDGLTRIGLVNNAADPGLLGPVAQLDVRRLAAVYAANAGAPIWLMGALVRLAPLHAALRIVNVSTGAAVRAFPGLAAYGSSKAALRMAGMVLSAELESGSDPTAAHRDIAILSYEPGTVDTPMQAWARAQSADVLPSVDLFRRFAAEQSLVKPEAPALEIVAFLGGDGGPRFQERRLS